MTGGGDPRAGRDGEIPGAGVLGMRIFLAALAVLFLASIAGYLVVRLKAPSWPPPGMPRLPSGLWLATGVLLAGSVAIHRALTRVRLGLTRPAARWTWVTLALALAFLAVQGWNWWGLVAREMTATTKNLYAFTFFMLTGLHAAHVVGGVILLGIVAMRASRGRYDAGRHAGITYAAMYWHFLDAVWIALFAVLLVFA